MNKKSLKIAATALFGFALILMIGLKVLAHFEHEAQKQTLSAAENAITSKNKGSGLGTYLKSSRVNYKEQLEKSAAIPKGCREYFDALEKLDLLTIEDQHSKVTFQELPALTAVSDCPFDSLGMSKNQNGYLEKCFPKDQNLSQEISSECSSQLFLIRASVTKVLLKDKNIKEMTDLRQLTDLLFSEFAEVFSSEKPNFERMRQVSGRMLELNPSLYAASKVQTAADVLDGFYSNKNGGAEADAAWKRAEASFAQMHALNSRDEGVSDMEIAVKTRGFDPEKSYDVSAQMTERDPSNAKGWFLMAYSQWKQGDHETSIENLKRAMSLDPNNKSYAQTLETLQKPGANGESFKGSFTIGINASDFEN